jgi:hypothetical protein
MSNIKSELCQKWNDVTKSEKRRFTDSIPLDRGVKSISEQFRRSGNRP